MDDIGNLIYILFVLVLFIVNVFTKKKKQQQKRGRADDPTTVGPPPSKGKTFEELLEEFTGGQTTTPEPVPAPRPAPKPKPAPVPAYQAPKPKPATPKKEHSIMKTDFGRFEEFEDEGRAASDYTEQFADLDGAKKAFIYSEIFNRKY